jgi:hypothetical protein
MHASARLRIPQPLLLAIPSPLRIRKIICKPRNLPYPQGHGGDNFAYHTHSIALRARDAVCTSSLLGKLINIGIGLQI